MSMKDMSRRQFRVPFHIAIAGAIIGIVAIMSLLTVRIIYYRGKPKPRLTRGCYSPRIPRRYKSVWISGSAH